MNEDDIALTGCEICGCLLKWLDKSTNMEIEVDSVPYTCYDVHILILKFMLKNLEAWNTSANIFLKVKK